MIENLNICPSIFNRFLCFAANLNRIKTKKVICTLFITVLSVICCASTGNAASDAQKSIEVEKKWGGDISIEICDWQGGSAGAASVSVDDSFPSCREKLNKNGLNGTYYLDHTDKYTQEQWDVWRQMYNEGHELGGHTTNHIQYVKNQTLLRWELSSNRDDIMVTLGIPEEKLVSFAWPCGESNPDNKKTASEYYLASRGYHINELEEKNPEDFMYLKSLNTPYYHVPEYDPPDLFEMADEAEELGKWANFVVHSHCREDGLIDYLAAKDLWVAPIGRVVKYIKERQNSEIKDIVQTGRNVNFTLTCKLDPSFFDEELSIKVSLNPDEVKAVLIDGDSITFKGGQDYLIFNARPSESTKIEIIKQQRLLVKGDAIVTNVWLHDQKKLDNLRNHKIKYLFVDIGDTKKNGIIKTPSKTITGFIDLIKTYEKTHNYDFILLPYSEINTFQFQLTPKFRENFIAEYANLISLGFDGIYIDIEPVKSIHERVYLELLDKISTTYPQEAIIGVYSGNIIETTSGRKAQTDWEWPLDFYRKVSNKVDFISVPAYDINIRDEAKYKTFIENQVEFLCTKSVNSKLFIVAPTHKKKPETIERALMPYMSIKNKYPYNPFLGICIFAEWTTNTNEWDFFDSVKQLTEKQVK